MCMAGCEPQGALAHSLDTAELGLCMVLINTKPVAVPRKVLLFRLSRLLTVEVCLAQGLLDALLSVNGELRCCILHVQALACKEDFVVGGTECERFCQCAAGQNTMKGDPCQGQSAVITSHCYFSFPYMQKCRVGVAKGGINLTVALGKTSACSKCWHEWQWV